MYGDGIGSGFLDCLQVMGLCLNAGFCPANAGYAYTTRIGPGPESFD